MKRLAIALIVGGCLLIVFLIGFGVRYVLDSVDNTVRNAYASDWTAAFVIEHLKTTPVNGLPVGTICVTNTT